MAGTGEYSTLNDHARTRRVPSDCRMPTRIVLADSSQSSSHEQYKGRWAFTMIHGASVRFLLAASRSALSHSHWSAAISG